MQPITTKSEFPPLDLPYEELKSYVLQAIRLQGSSFQFSSLNYNLCETIYKDGAGFDKSDYVKYEKKLAPADENRVREIIWDLIIQRVLTIGSYQGPNWPHISLTQYGAKVLNSSEPIPHDPAEYIKRVLREIPEIDPVILTYLTESISTYNINQLLSAAITLGCASEKALLLLIDAYADSFKDEKDKLRFIQKVNNRMIKRQFEEFQKEFNRTSGGLPPELTDNYQNIFLGVFEMFRNQRNSAGHPTNHTVYKEMLFANLQVFITYCRFIYQLINYFKSNSHD
jgi:hypothetical protein